MEKVTDSLDGASRGTALRAAPETHGVSRYCSSEALYPDTLRGRPACRRSSDGSLLPALVVAILAAELNDERGRLAARFVRQRETQNRP